MINHESVVIGRRLALQLLHVQGRKVMQFDRILVAVNSPNGRDAAFERALALGRQSGAELYLLHAVPVDQPFSYRAAGADGGYAPSVSRGDSL